MKIMKTLKKQIFSMALFMVISILFCLNVNAQPTNPFQGNTVSPLGMGNTGSYGTMDPGSIALGPSLSRYGWIRNDLGSRSGLNVIVTASTVNIRSGPSVDFEALTTASMGSEFVFAGEENGWYKLDLQARPQVTPVSSDKIQQAQDNFLKAYKVYTSSVLKNGKGSTQSKAALKEFQSTYALYKVALKGSQPLADVKSGRAATSKVVVSKANFTATVYSNGQIVRVFPIAYGSNPDGLNKVKQGDCRTPEGNFEFTRKVVNPAYKGVPWSPSSPVGTRWLQLNAGGGSIALHGTNAPGSIGTRASHGCVRMYTKDAEELFDLIKVGTPVIIKPVKEG
ncbi:MAG: L,D-transpeptidase family protein [Candidatus Riflebacteria bacterium]|nr:L,D-transpeptidase family protein [Candidatus Riflebacteria bacterium]